MSGKKVEGTFAEAWKPTERGQTIIGIYLGSQKVDTEKGGFTAYHFKTADSDGKRFSVAGAGLDNKMPCIPRKTECTIVFQGTQKLGKGDMKLFDVFVPEGVTLLDPFDLPEHE